MFIQHSWFATLQISNCLAERARGNHEVTFSVTASDDRLDSLMITALHKYILKKVYIERIIHKIV